MYIAYYQNLNDNSNLNYKYEGIGAQYQRIVTLIAIARHHNLKFIHFPIKVGHNYNNDPEWNEKWEKMFNIKKLANNDEVDYSKLEKKYNKNDINLDQLIEDNKTNLLNYYHALFKIFDSNPDYYLSFIQKDIIDAYNEVNSIRELIYDKNKINIAIHLRVINDYDDNENMNDYLNNTNMRHYMKYDMYIILINKLNNTYPNADIHIFSQEKYFDLHYSKLKIIENIKIHFDDLDTFDTFHHLCKADVLCLGTSSFSFLAGFYNKNTVIYLPYFHPPALKSWICYNPFN
jgi:hypothetical protein